MAKLLDYQSPEPAKSGNSWPVMKWVMIIILLLLLLLASYIGWWLYEVENVHPEWL